MFKNTIYIKIWTSKISTIILCILILMLSGCTSVRQSFFKSPPNSIEVIDGVSYSGRREVEAEVSKLMDNKQYDELNKLEVAFRADNAMTASGWPLIFVFYQALKDLSAKKYVTQQSLDEVNNQIANWIANNPNSQFGHFYLVDIFFAQAWQARGTGYANSVSKLQWKIFNADMNKAYRYLDEYKDELAENPRWYMDMLDIANYQSWPSSTYDSILAEALSKHKSYLPFYIFPIFHYTPKWGGSYGGMISFINKSTAQLTAPLSDEYYARQYSYATENHLLPTELVSQSNCNRWLIGFDDILKKYPTSYNYNHAAYAATLCGNRSKANGYFSNLGKQPPDLSFWGSYNNFTLAREWSNKKP